ncbi:phosphotransferase [Pyxidicoccus sp. 3LG]
MRATRSPSRALTAAEVVEAIRFRFPSLGGLPVEPLGEGTDHRVYEVGGHYVFRFPKEAEAAEGLEVEARLTAWLAPHLPLAVPSYRYVGRPDERFPWSFAGYEKLAGTPALLVDPDRLDLVAIGRRMGDFLRNLHGLDVAEAEALGVPRDDDPTLEAWSAEALSELRFALEQGHVDAAIAARWERSFAAPPSSKHVPRRVLHADLAAEHVLLDARGAPTAVIDWSDAMLGDPALDLAGLLHWGGARMLSSSLETYGPVDDTLVERARWFAACRAVADLVFGERQQRREYVVAGQRALAGLRPPAR